MPRTLPASWYCDPQAHQRERDSIFGREWLLVAHGSQLADAGDYVATEVAGWPVVVVRGEEGELRAFHNVCRHRAGPLVWDGAGHVRSLVCRYHGWAYGLDGGLVSARDFGAEVGECGLAPLSLALWRGLVFVNLCDDPEPLMSWLDGLVEECAAFPLEDLVVAGQATHELACNWKTYADNYLEGYHIPLVHPELNKQIDAKRYRVDVGRNWCRHSAPTRDGAPTAGRWLWHWPNLALNVYPEGMNIERFFPVAADRCRVEYTFCFLPGHVDDDAMRLSTELMDEDRRICEAVQRNLASGVYDTGELSPRHEGGVALFQELVRAAIWSGKQYCRGE